MNGPRISLLLVGLFIDGRWKICGIWIKKKFLFCYPHTLTIGLEAPVYRGFSGEGKGEGKSNEELRMKNEEWRMKNEEWRMKNEEWRMKNEELSASPIKKQDSVAEGKANVEFRIVGFAD